MASSARIRITSVKRADVLDPQLLVAMFNLTSNVALRMRRLVPKRSFRLHDTITDHGAKVVGSKIVGTVGAGGRSIRGKMVNYHLFVERGTSRQRAQPYMRPALLQSRSADLRTRASGF